MRRLNPLLKNVLVFIIVLLIFGAAYFYVKRKSAVNEHMAKSEMGAAQTRATEEYIRYFGKVPDVGMIRCEGLVIYYPGKEKGTFLPYPYFVTTPEKKEILVARTMLAGLPLKKMGEYVAPIFSGIGELEDISIQDDTLHLSIRSSIGVTEKDLEITARAFLLTYGQLNRGVNKAVIRAGNRVTVEVTSPGGVVLEPGPPVLLDAFLVTDEGNEKPHEMRLIFDRPVMIDDVALFTADGEELFGKVYLAEFSMAGIFKQDKNMKLNEGDAFTVRFNIHDYLGRKSKGEASFTARIEAHPGIPG